MNKQEIFENLVEPLKSSLNKEQWDFLLSRGKKFSDQILNFTITDTKIEQMLSDKIGTCTEKEKLIAMIIGKMVRDEYELKLKSA